MYMYACMCVCMNVCMNVNVYVCMYVRVCMCKYTYLHTFGVCTSMCLRVYVCLSVGRINNFDNNIYNDIAYTDNIVYSFSLAELKTGISMKCTCISP